MEKLDFVEAGSVVIALLENKIRCFLISRGEYLYTTELKTFSTLQHKDINALKAYFNSIGAVVQAVEKLN